MKWAIAAVIIVATAVLLTGCGRPDDSISEGIRCAKAGGDWVWSSWDGYHCNIYGSKDGGHR